MTYDEWEASVSDFIKSDLLWKMQAYRLALFVGDLGWHDITRLSADPRTALISGQPYRSLGSITANLAEGYSKLLSVTIANVRNLIFREDSETYDIDTSTNNQ